jgi:membrane-bound lytic murein transglycosylase A
MIWVQQLAIARAGPHHAAVLPWRLAERDRVHRSSRRFRLHRARDLSRQVLNAAISTVLSLLVCACAAPAPPRTGTAELVPLSEEECRTLLSEKAPVDGLRQATQRSVDYLQRLPAERELPAMDRRARAGDLAAMLEALSSARDVAAWHEQICSRWRVYRAIFPPGASQLLITGYYQPELEARYRRSERFRYPLYRTPDDLVDIDLGPFCPACAGRVTQGRVHDGKLVPYHSRSEIEAGALDGRGYEIAWLDDPVEVFFLHIQGSGRLRFEDGVVMEVSYASANGRPYTSIGRLLVERGAMSPETVSLQALKQYLRTHPDEQGTLMAANERYIFFRTVAVGPVGSLGVPLTAGRSLAADARVYPPGGLAFVRIVARGAEPGTEAPALTQRFALIQDAGIAITGPARLDVYWGTGDAAAALAGDMRNPGEIYLILPE